jgi:hypothetical protein
VLVDAGLWGDGDEVETLKLIEKRLNIRLRDEDAPAIWTVGDLWDRLRASNPKLTDTRRDWIRFVVALTAFTGLNPRLIGRETALIVFKKPGLIAKAVARWRGNHA